MRYYLVYRSVLLQFVLGSALFGAKITRLQPRQGPRSFEAKEWKKKSQEPHPRRNKKVSPKIVPLSLKDADSKIVLPSLKNAVSNIVPPSLKDGVSKRACNFKALDL